MARKRDPLELNKREKDILKFIETELNENGYPPSVREIGKAVGLKSTATVHSYLGRLEDGGSSRRAWIEIIHITVMEGKELVALLTESVD